MSELTPELIFNFTTLWLAAKVRSYTWVIPAKQLTGLGTTIPLLPRADPDGSRWARSGGSIVRYSRTLGWAYSDPGTPQQFWTTVLRTGVPQSLAKAQGPRRPAAGLSR